MSEDARLKKLVLTPKAEAMNEAIMKDINELEEVLVQGFSKEEIDTFCSFIKRMKQNLTNSKTN